MRAARKARGWTLADMAEVLKETGVSAIHPSTIARMEDGSRPGEPRVWGKMWEVLQLPLRELYEGLELPVPEQLPNGTVGEILELVRSMPDEAQQLTLGFARHAPALLVAAMLPSQPPLGLTSREEDTVPTGPKSPWLRAAEEKGGYAPSATKPRRGSPR